MDYCIRKLLRLTEENFITDENWLEIVTENNETVHKIKGTWTNTYTSCLYYSSENVIKHLRNTNICDTNQCQYNLWDNWLVHKTV